MLGNNRLWTCWMLYIFTKADWRGFFQAPVSTDLQLPSLWWKCVIAATLVARAVLRPYPWVRESDDCQHVERMFKENSVKDVSSENVSIVPSSIVIQVWTPVCSAGVVIVLLRRKPCCWPCAPTSSFLSWAPGSAPLMASSPETSSTGNTQGLCVHMWLFCI